MVEDKEMILFKAPSLVYFICLCESFPDNADEPRCPKYIFFKFVLEVTQFKLVLTWNDV